ncbi:MAG: ATP-binding protein [Candidatus Sulfobium sp.]|jgi:PAS domain S-box-containing protein
MENVIFTVIILSSLFLVLILMSTFRALMNFHRKKVKKEENDTTQVGFVVDTFHELVAKLKEKERELEGLKTRAEDRASSIEIYNEDILQSVPSGVISFDKGLIITKMNSSAGKILDLTEDEVIGKDYDSVLSGPVADVIGERKTVERAEVAYVTGDGKRIWLGLNMSPLKDSANNIIGQILVFTDLTELKAFQSQMELRERLSNLGEMSAGIAHELRNPLGVISGYTKMLMKKAGPGSLAAVEAIAKEVEVMDRIIKDFLSFAKPTEPAFSEVDLNELIDGCLGGIPGGEEGIKVIRKTDGLSKVRGDEVLLRQALTNLVQNAIESMPDGGELRISGSGGDPLSVAVSDTGHGIPESIRDKIYMPFFTTKERGTGLGLSIVHKIVVSHGGSLDVESGEQGTTFTINLPKS